MANTLESALNYAKAGLKVFPLKGNSKEPFLKWRQEATTEAEKIKAWWQSQEYNIAICCGDGLLVIDVDVKDGAEGLESLSKYGAELPKTMTVQTPSGGYHYYYYVNGSYKNSVGLYPGIDIRSDGGYIVAPPSIINGMQYTVINNEPIAEATPEVYNFLSAGLKADVKPQAENAINQGARNDYMFRLASSLQAKNMSDTAIYNALMAENKVRCNPPLSDEEIKTIVNSSLKYNKGTSQNSKQGEKPPTLILTSGSQLEKMDIPPIVWIVKDLIPIGLGILGAPPKYFKSFLALGLCINVSLGEPFLGYDTVKSDVLYFDLESTKRRPKDRLQKIMGDDFPDNLYIVTGEQDVRDLANGFLDQLGETLDNKPNIKLVIIDVYQKIRPAQKSNKNAYDRDYDDLSGLKKFADERSICILLIHHTKKGKESDVFDQMSGSTGLNGAMDLSIVITKDDRYSDDAVLNITGRDIESKRLRIKFNKDTFQWEYVGDFDTIEAMKMKYAYENNPITLVIKQCLENAAKNNVECKMSAKDLIDYSNTFTNYPIEDTPQKVGLFIKTNEKLLNDDGIEIKFLRDGKKRTYVFTIMS